jgi:hypothetical protein
MDESGMMKKKKREAVEVNIILYITFRSPCDYQLQIQVGP